MSCLAVCPAPSHLVPVAKGWGGGRAGGVRPPPPRLARSVPGGLEEVLPWRRHAPHPLTGPGSQAWCLRFSPPAPPPPSLALQPRSCIAPWRPSSELSQVRKCKGLPTAKSLRASGTYPATRSCSQQQRRGGRDPSPAPLSSLTTEALPGGRICLPTSHHGSEGRTGEDSPPLPRPSLLPLPSAPS